MTKKIEPPKNDAAESAPETGPTPNAGDAPKPDAAKDEKNPPVVDPKPPTLSAPDGKTPMKTAEQWADAKQTPAWLFKATRVGLRWPIGREMTEADYDAGVTWAAHAPCR